jgi:hypothetical protein
METCWTKNLHALQQRNPELAQRLQSCDLNPSQFVIGKAQDSSPVIGMRLANGQCAALGHSVSPQQDAVNWVGGLATEFKENANVLLLGFGTGYHPRALFEASNPQTQIWVAEPNLLLFKTALHAMDVSDLLASDRVHLLVGQTEKDTASLLFRGSASYRTLAQGIRLAMPVYAQHLYAEYIQRLTHEINETMQLHKLRFNTSEQQGEQVTRHCLANLPAVLNSAPVLTLLSAFPGCPALVVAPGPSLQEQLPGIAACRDRVILIAVDTAHRILLHHDIQADFVVALDFTDLNAKHFDGIHDTATHLVAFPGIHPAIVEQYNRRTFFFDHSSSTDGKPGATPLLKLLRALPPLGDIISYGSTAHAAYHLARLMGCSPIVLVGNDLSFPNDRQYSPGAMQNDLEKAENGEMPSIEIPANDGRTVKTIGLYKIYLDTFGELIQGTGGMVCNPSPHGAQIANAAYRPWEELLSGFPSKPIDKRGIAACAVSRHLVSNRSILGEIKDLLHDCRSTRKELQKIIVKLNRLSPTAASFQRDMLAILKQFMELMQRRERPLAISTPLCSRSTVAFIGQLENVGIVGGKTPEENQIARHRCQDFFEDIAKALKTNAALLQSAIQACSS